MHSPAVHRRLEQTEQAFHDLNSRGGLEGNDDQGGTRVASPTARCFHPPSKTPIPHNSPFRWRKGKTSTSCPTRGPTRHKFTTHSTRGSNKQTKLYQDSTARGNCRERRSGGGTRVASPNSALLSSLHKTDSRQFPLSAKQKKNEHKLHSNRERERPPALAPNTNDTPRPNNIPMMMMDSDSFQTRARRSRCPKVIAKQTKDRKKRTSKHALSRKEDVSSLTYPKPPNTQKEKGSEFSYP
jgi:hypothetical protein